MLHSRRYDFFRKITIGDGNNAIIMGKNTFLSLPHQKPLPKRLNIVVSSTYVNQSSDPNLIITSTLKDAIKIANDHNCDQIFFIGGTQIITDAFSEFVIKKIYISYIHSDFTILQNNIDTTRQFHFTNIIQESKKYSETLLEHISKEDYFINFKVYDRLSEEFEYLNIVKKYYSLEKGEQIEQMLELYLYLLNHLNLMSLITFHYSQQNVCIGKVL